ncbi:MAG: DUF559 domain-containing protein [Pseudomonadota bacterium]
MRDSPSRKLEGLDCLSQGYQILRFSNRDVMENLEGVVSHIKTTLAQAHPRPLPPAGGEQVE